MFRRRALLCLSGLLAFACTKKDDAPSVEDHDSVLADEDGGPGAVMTIRRLERAKKFPLEVPDAPSLKRGQPNPCPDDGKLLEPLIVTTFGPLGDPAVWRAYPLALEAWRCPGCKRVTYPAFLEPAQVTALLDDGVARARRGDLDSAEYMFRRVMSSWPGYATARVNLGSIYLDRARRAAESGALQEEVNRHGKIAIEQLEKALLCTPPPPERARFMLGKAHVRGGDRARGKALLAAYAAADAAEEPLRTEARAILAE